MTARVAWISLTPVKGLSITQVDEVELDEHGLHGDRRFYFVDEAGRLVNCKRPRRSVLHTVRAEYDETARMLTVRTRGSEVHAEAEPGEELVTDFHHEPRRARRVAGPWDDLVSELVGEPVRLVAPDGRAPDRGASGATTILATASLAALARELGVEQVDPRRFRMSFGVEGLAAHEEDAWLGRRVRVGGAVVVPQGNVGRCAITTQNPETGASDLDTLNALARYRGELAATEPLPFGVHAAVAEPGRVRLGDPVELL